MDVNLAFTLIITAIIVIIVLPRLKVNIAIAIITGAMFLLVTLGANWGAVLGDLLQWSFWRIIVIVFLSLLIVALMEKTGYLNMMVDAVKKIAPSLGSSLVSISAFIGLLPMPGGAYVSAKLVDPLTKEMNLNPVESTSLNYWFRHLWEYAWPLYTGVIVAAEIFGVSISDFVMHMSFLPLIAITSGFLFIYLPIMKRKNIRIKNNKKEGAFKDLIFASWPVILVMELTLLGVPWVEKGRIVLMKIDLFYSLLITDTLLIAIIMSQKKWNDVKYSLRFALKPTFLGVTFAALFMKIAVLETNSMHYTYTFFNMYGIPSFVVIIILPYLAGLMTGVTVAYVAATFPLLLPYMGDPVNFAAVALAYASGYSGHLTSPVHLCLVLSSEHFKANLYKVIIRVLPSVIFVLGTTLIIYFFA